MIRQYEYDGLHVEARTLYAMPKPRRPDVADFEAASLTVSWVDAGERRVCASGASILRMAWESDREAVGRAVGELAVRLWLMAGAAQPSLTASADR
jgi:hypothetical protein